MENKRSRLQQVSLGLAYLVAGLITALAVCVVVLCVVRLIVVFGMLFALFAGWTDLI